MRTSLLLNVRVQMNFSALTAVMGVLQCFHSHGSGKPSSVLRHARSVRAVMAVSPVHLKVEVLDVRQGEARASARDVVSARVVEEA